MVKIQTLLLTDVVDSTRLSERLGDSRMSALWQEHDHVARSLLRRWRGREIDKSDGFLFLFDDASDAIGYAVAYHAAIAALSVPLRARAGLHTGPVLQRANPDEDVARGAKPVEIDGLTKAIAARVMAISQGGQTLLTAEARDVLRHADIQVGRMGMWRMKGIDAPIEVFEVVRNDARTAEPVDSDKGYRVVIREGVWVPIREIAHSLPAGRDKFVGRESALRALDDQLETGARLISVLGPGGVGKTRLVQHFGWSRLGEFTGGVWFCDLTNARSVDGILQGVASGLGVSLGQADPTDQLGSAIAGRGRCLVVLDNFEQVASFAEDTLGRWLNRAIEARFIVTSRAVLGIPGENTFSLDVLTEREGLELFSSRARSVLPQFHVTEQDQLLVRRLVRMLEGLPLAIELAAARVAVLPVSALLERMNNRFAVLTSRIGRRTRQATLQATFDWSWDLLNEVEKSALAQLSVFDGGCSLFAAETILDLGDPENDHAAIDVLQSLAQKSLVQIGRSNRSSLLATVREYASGRLETPGAGGSASSACSSDLRLRHCRYFASLGETGAVADGCADGDNVTAACKHAVEHGYIDMAIGALEGAWATLRLRGPFKAGVELATLVRTLPLQTPSEVARVDRILGLSLRAAGRLAEASVSLEAALASAVDAGRSDLECRLLSQLGELNRMCGRLSQAEAQLSKALEMAKQFGERGVECEALNAMGDLLENSGQLSRALTYYEEAVAMARLAQDRRREGGSLGNLGLLCANLGRMEEARTHYEASLRIAREVGDRQWEGNTLCNLGLLHQIQGRLTDSRENLEAASVVAMEMGYVRLTAVVMCNLGLVHEAMLDPARALSCYEEALTVAREIGDPRSEGQFLTYLGLLHARQGRHVVATECLDNSEVLLTEVADRLSFGLLQCARAEAEQLAGRLLEASTRFEDAAGSPKRSARRPNRNWAWRSPVLASASPNR